jgi:hypothetical protein
MLRNRNLRRSINDHVSALLTSGSYGLSAYNVYNESDMRGGTEVEFPYVYLVDVAVDPTPTMLPLIMVEVARIKQASFELGNRSGRFLLVYLHVIASNRGERDDLASMLQDNIGQSITVYDYSTGTGVADGTVIELGTEIDQWDAPPAGGSLRQEGTMLNMSVVSFTGVTSQ